MDAIFLDRRAMDAIFLNRRAMDAIFLPYSSIGGLWMPYSWIAGLWMPYSWIGQAMDAIFLDRPGYGCHIPDAIQWTLGYPDTCVHSTSLGYEVRITEIRMGRASKFYVI